jgi:DNA-binding NarL/FixJ family response regulator
MVNVFLVAPIRLHRDGLLTSLNQMEGVSVVGAASTFDEALPRLRELRTDVTLLDTLGPEDIDALASQSAEAKLVAIGIPEHQALAWVEAGVVGYVPPEASIEDLTVAIARIARGELVISPEVAVQLLSRVRRVAAQAAHAVEDERLTPRERQVLELIAEGFPNKLIARRLSIQEQTVKNHVHKILLKLGVHRRTEAAALLRAQSHKLAEQ